MTFRTLIRRSLRFHARAHLGVVLGATIGSAALIGALVVGDSVRESLRERALSRLGWVHFAISTQDMTFDQQLCDSEVRFAVTRFASGSSQGMEPEPGLQLSGVVTRQDGNARANEVTILGMDRYGWASNWKELWQPSRSQNTASNSAGISQYQREEAVLQPWRKGETAMINETLARQLRVGPGDQIVVRIRKPSFLAQDAAINSSEQNVIAVRFKVGAILTPRMVGDFSLIAQGNSPAIVFVPLDVLQKNVGLPRQANLLLCQQFAVIRDPTKWDERRWALADRLNSLVGHNAWLVRLANSIKPSTMSLVSDQEGLGLLRTEVENSWSLEDVGLSLRDFTNKTLVSGQTNATSIELVTSRVFLDGPASRAALTPASATALATCRQPSLIYFDDEKSWRDYTNHMSQINRQTPFVTNGFGVLTYLANLIRSGNQATPYSMVTAAGGPYTPKDMRDDEILVNQWLADDLKVKPGDPVELSYYVPDSGAKLLERTNTFHVRGIVPLQGIYADRTLMPDFPGVAKAESTQDWEGFPLRYKVRDKDEAYWRAYRGTPKAFITLAAGQAMWASRFGSLTAVRYPVPTNMTAQVCREVVYRNLIANLKPSDVGLSVVPVREQALKAADQSQDFGQLFLGFSLFLVVAALMLMALLFQFGLEQRTREIGTFLALGFTPKQVRRLLLGEGAMLALAGGVLGAIGGLGYAKAMIWGLTTVWRNAVGDSALQFHASAGTLIIGVFASTIVATLTIWLTLRKQARLPAVLLLAGEMGNPKAEIRDPKEIRNPKSEIRNRGASVRNYPSWVAMGSAAGAAGIVGWALASGETANAGAFFGAGALLLVAGLATVAAWLQTMDNGLWTRDFGLGALDFRLRTLGFRSCARRRTRSLATVALLACGCFVIVSIGVFRLDANRDASRRSSGTGGFALLGETTMPVGQDLNTQAGLEAYALDTNELAGVRFVPVRLHEGDEASCLNLNRAQKPRLLGVRPELLDGRFTFAKVASGDRRNGWELLQTPPSSEEIPAIGDANSIEWALGKKVGDTIDYTDEHGRAFKLRLVGAVANSILQGSLLIDEAAFTSKFPSESGYRVFLLDAQSNSIAKVSATLTRAMQDAGLELTPTIQRLDAFNAVQNTYLGTFQVLGGLGLLLGSAGLGVVVLRNVLERRGELGVLVAVGFRRRTLHWLVLIEHGALLALGLAVGIIAAVVAVLPTLLVPGTQLPYASLAVTLGAVLLNGVAWAWLATRFALRGDLLAALREE